MKDVDTVTGKAKELSEKIDILFLETLHLSQDDIKNLTYRDTKYLIDILSKHYREREKEQIIQDQKDAAKNIGRCFKLGKSYVKVISIPQPESTMTGVVFNKYQYPAVWIDESEKDPIYHDNLFINGESIGGFSIKTRITPIEITPEEFAEKLKHVSDSYIQKILEIRT